MSQNAIPPFHIVEHVSRSLGYSSSLGYSRCFNHREADVAVIGDFSLDNVSLSSPKAQRCRTMFAPLARCARHSWYMTSSGEATRGRFGRLYWNQSSSVLQLLQWGCTYHLRFDALTRRNCTLARAAEVELSFAYKNAPRQKSNKP